MSNFSFLSSLINPPVQAVEDAVEPIQESAVASERVVVDETTIIGNPRSSAVPMSLYVTYSHPNMEDEMYLVVHAWLEADLNSEDESFDYEYGSERGRHGGVVDYLEDLSWRKVTFPQTADNMDLYKLPPEQHKHVAQFVNGYLTSMSDEEISSVIDVEKVVELLRSEFSNH